MFFSVRELELRKAGFDLTFPPGKLDLSETDFRQVSPARVTGVAELLRGTDEIRVRGHFCGELEADCDRCLEAARFPIDREFDLFYRPASGDSDAADLELDESESQVGYYEGEGLQLADVIREQVLLWLPMQWVCSEACKGICPVCGGNRNRVLCGCQEQRQDDRWSALRNFRPSTRE
ncbi:MAG: DUF177 domain-containing protein [Bryobacteraceae bacterium]|nr:DUF177 domain-containing protein [Bryobacteraceae bacterium]